MSEPVPGPSDPGVRLAQLVHDLRTPLTLVLGFSDLLRRHGDELEAEQRADYLRRIDDAARDMRRILDAQR